MSPRALLAMAVLVTVHACAPATGAQVPLPGSDERSVLVLLSSHEGDPQSLAVMRGMSTVFDSSGSRVSLWVESLDSRRNRGRGYYEDLVRLYARKLASARFDLVIAVGNEALEFALERRSVLAPAAPLVFAGVDRLDAARLAAASDVTGIRESIDFRSTLDTALALHPATRTIVLLTPGLDRRYLIEALIPDYRTELDLEVWSDDTLDAIIERLAEVPADAIVVPVGEPRLANGRKLETDEFVRVLAPRTRAPLYTVWDVALGHGIVGGKLVSAQAQGAGVARLALRVLGGEPAERIPVVTGDHASFQFDHAVLSGFGLSPSDLPLSARLINIPVSFYRTHRDVLLSAAAIIVTLTVFIVALLRNIAIRRRAEAELQVREQELDAIFRASPAELHLKDADGLYVRVNPQFERAYGVSESEAAGRLPADVLPADLAAAVRAGDEAVLRSGEPFLEELHHVSAPDGGRTHTLLAARFPVRDELGRVAGLGAVVTDISDLRAAETALRESEARFRDFLDNSPTAVSLTDLEGRYVLANPTFETLMGVELDALLGRSAPEVFEAGFAASSAAHDADVLARAAAVSREESVLVAGERRDLLSVKFPVRSGAGVIVGLGSIAVDITDLKRAERALREREQRFREYAEAELAKARTQLVRQTRLSVIGQMASSLAHDIRNPLGSIRNAAYYLRRRVPEQEPKWASYLDLIEREVVASDRIISHMMDMVRDRPLDLAAVDLESLVADVEQRLRRDSPVQVERDLPPGPFTITVDAAQFERVLDNLLTNAVQATGGAGRVVVRGRREGESDIITVLDDGPGVPAGEIEHLFEPLVTTKPKGTGLGLAICEQIVSQHGGTIAYEPALGGGAGFRVELPATCAGERNT